MKRTTPILILVLCLAIPAAAEEGTQHPTPWSFKPISDAPVPATESSWASNAIDAFILEAMETKGLSPSPEADKRTLIRRLYLDVLGLPPTPEEVEAFVYDNRPDAYEVLVDHVLASPHYGERWARHWLDAVRFAETNGYETNTPRANAWPYRDYVINALNADIPYTQFVREQLAGDTLGADAATGFLVGGPTDIVKSPDVVLTKNQRDADLDDMIGTTSGAFLGITLRCAKCHDHKFDPISQHDYFAMRALIQGVQHGERELRPPDADERLAKAEAVKQQIQDIDAQLATFRPKANTSAIYIDDEPGPQFAFLTDPSERVTREPHERYANSAPDLAFHRWKAEPDTALCRWTPGVEGEYGVWCARSTAEGAAINAKLVASVRAQNGGEARVVPLAEGNLTFIGNMTLDADSTFTLHAAESEFSDAGVLILVPEGNTSPPTLRGPVNALGNVEQFEPIQARYVRFNVRKTNTIAPCIDELEIFEAGTGTNVALATAGSIPSSSSEYGNNEKHKTIHLNDGQYGNSRSWIPGALESWAQIEFAEPKTIDRVAWARDREGAFDDRLAIDYTIEVATELGQWTTVASSRDRSSYVKAKRPVQVYATADGPERLDALLGKRSTLVDTQRGLTQFPRVYAGNFTDPGVTKLLHRGDPMMERHEIPPGVVKGIAPELAIEPTTPDQQRRIALADYICDPQNPLTARVMVNRIWQHHFGEGIVRTPSDFGSMGAKPSHPELLDWLATRFMESGWRMKAMHKLILTSSTYRQSSKPRASAIAIDGESRYLWRFPPRRLAAEPIRDMILAVSGVLDRRMGGPGYDVFEPNSNYVHVYIPKRAFGPEEWRRMIYQFKPRMEQDETFGVFDCPDAAQTAPSRNVSTTPLQALNLMNSPFMVQQAELFSKRIANEADTPAAQVTRAFQLALGRAPDRDEMAAATEFIAGEGLHMFCRALYNTNEFLHLQ